MHGYISEEHVRKDFFFPPWTQYVSPRCRMPTAPFIRQMFKAMITFHLHLENIRSISRSLPLKPAPVARSNACAMFCNPPFPPLTLVDSQVRVHLCSCSTKGMCTLQRLVHCYATRLQTTDSCSLCLTFIYHPPDTTSFFRAERQAVFIPVQKSNATNVTTPWSCRWAMAHVRANHCQEGGICMQHWRLNVLYCMSDCKAQSLMFFLNIQTNTRTDTFLTSSSKVRCRDRLPSFSTSSTWSCQV